MLSKILVLVFIISFCHRVELRTIGIQKINSVSDFPFAVSIEITSKSELYSDTSGCTGSLIRLDVVLTVAQCLSIPNHKEKILGYTQIPAADLSVRAGASSSSNACDLAEFKASQKRNVIQTALHGCYKAFSKMYDVGLIKLAQMFDPTNKVATICLAIPEIFGTATLLDYYKGTEECVVVGWGRRRSAINNTCLYAALVPLISNKECAKLRTNITDPDMHMRRKIYDNEICTYAQGSEFCWDGLGSPLVCQSVQIGIAVTENLCYGNRSDPVIWARIDTYHEWIIEQIKKFGEAPQPKKNIENGSSIPKIHCLNILIMYFIWNISSLF